MVLVLLYIQYFFSQEYGCSYEKTAFQQGLALNDTWIVYMASPSTLGSSLLRQVMQAAGGKKLIITRWSLISGMLWDCAGLIAVLLVSFGCYSHREGVQRPADPCGCQTH